MNPMNVLIDINGSSNITEFINNVTPTCNQYKQPVIYANVPIFLISAIVSFIALAVVPFLPEKYREKVTEKMMVTVFMINLGFALVSIFQSMGL